MAPITRDMPKCTSDSRLILPIRSCVTFKTFLNLEKKKKKILRVRLRLVGEYKFSTNYIVGYSKNYLGQEKKKRRKKVMHIGICCLICQSNVAKELYKCLAT